jgi:hypothetical protein
MDIEKIFAAIRAYAAEHDYKSSCLSFHGFFAPHLPLAELESEELFYCVDAVNRRNGSANGFRRYYLVMWTPAGSCYVYEAQSAEDRGRLVSHAIEQLRAKARPAI